MKKYILLSFFTLFSIFFFSDKVFAIPIQNVSSTAFGSYSNYAVMDNLVSQGSSLELSTDSNSNIKFGYNDYQPLLTNGNCNSSYFTFSDNMSKHCFFRTPTDSDAADYLFPGLATYSYYGDSTGQWYSYIYQLEEDDYLKAGEEYSITLSYAFALNTLSLDQALSLTDFTAAGNFLVNHLSGNGFGDWANIKDYDRTYSVLNGVDYFNNTCSDSSCYQDFVFINVSFKYTPSVEVSSFLLQSYTSSYRLNFGSVYYSLMAFYYPNIFTDKIFSEDYISIDVPVTDKYIMLSGVSSGNIFVDKCYNPSNPNDYVPFKGDFFYFNENYADMTSLPYDNLISRTIFDNIYEFNWIEGFKFNLYGNTGYTAILYQTDFFNTQGEDIEETKKGFFGTISNIWSSFVTWLMPQTGNLSSQSENMYVCSFYIPADMHYSKVIINHEYIATDPATGDIYSTSADFSYIDSSGTLINVDNGLDDYDIVITSQLSGNEFVKKFDNSLSVFTSGMSTLSSTLFLISENLNPTFWAFIIIIFCLLLMFFFLWNRK